MKRRKVILISIPVIFVVLIFVSFLIYTGDYYKVSREVEDYIASQHCEQVSVEINSDRVVFSPENPAAGIIFYPGGKVEYTAYAPLLESLAEEGVLCVLLKMPFNLAVFNKNAAEGIIEQYPEVSSWYMSGHSLGGAMASYYIENNSDKYDGIILMAAYSNKDISKTNLDVLILYGSCDQVMNKENLDKCKSNLPDNAQIVEIPGGCHAYFGNYGSQSGDGDPTITCQEQQDIAKTEIINFIYK